MILDVVTTSFVVISLVIDDNDGEAGVKFVFDMPDAVCFVDVTGSFDAVVTTLIGGAGVGMAVGGATYVDVEASTD